MPIKNCDSIFIQKYISTKNIYFNYNYKKKLKS